MGLLNDLVTDYSERFGKGLSLPEYRQIELYARKKRIGFSDTGNEPIPAVPGLLGLNTTFFLLDGWHEGQDATLEGKTLWQRYLALPKRSVAEKLVAEVYRIFRIIRLSSLHATDQIGIDDGLVTFFCLYDGDALKLTITPLGLELLRSLVVYYLDSVDQPYGDAYVEAMLMEYYTDIIGEIKSFADEDRALFQFRRKYNFTRNLRLDCDSPRFSAADGVIRFEIGDLFANSARYPIDLFVVIDDCLYIIPIEALTDFSLPESDLPKWRARVAGATLPARFHARFGRTIQIIGRPMT